jgi:hypothetical protein
MFSTDNRFMRRMLGIAVAASAVAAFALVQSGAAGPGSLGAFFFGPKLVRAEVIMNEGGTIHDYRVDRGKIRAVTPTSLTLFERDGTLVTVPVAASADVRLDGVTVPLTRLRKRFTATTVRDGAASASIVVATRN